MKKMFVLPVVVAGSLALSGCFDGSSSSSIPTTSTPTTQVRVLHGVSDAPLVNIGINGANAIEGADYKDAGVLNPEVGTYDVTVNGILPGGATTTVIGPASLTFAEGINYDIIASGNLGDESIAPIILEDDGEFIDASMARLRVVHLSQDAQMAAMGGPVDVYLTLASDGDVLPADPSFTFSFGENVGPLEVAAETYRIRVTPADDDTVVYDSGSVPLPAGADLLVAAIDNTVYGDAPVSLLIVNGDVTTEILNAGTGAGIRAVHNSSDVGNVDIYVNAEPDGSSAAVNDLAFGETVPTFPITGEYVQLATGENRVAVTGTGGTAAAIDETLNLAAGDLRTIIAAGSVGGEIEALVFPDDNRGVATAAKLRVIHGAVEAQVVDVYLVPAADAGEGVGNAEPALPNFAYGTSSGYLNVAAGGYVVFITDTDGNELFQSGTLTLETGGVYTAVARLNKDSGSVATITAMDDFVVPPI